jgi:hypothetical protein
VYKNADFRLHNVSEHNREFYAGFCSGVDEIRWIQKNIEDDIKVMESRKY